MKPWTPRKIRAFCNKLARILRSRGIRCTRMDVSEHLRCAVLKLDGAYAAGLDFDLPGQLTCTSGTLRTHHGVDELESLVRRLEAGIADAKRRRPETRKPARLEVRSNRPF